MKKILIFIALTFAIAFGASAQMVGVAGSSYNDNNSSLYRPTGHYLRMEAGFPTFISAAYGYQILHGLFVGAGIGFGLMPYDYTYYSYYHNESYLSDGLGLPVFAEIIYSTPRKKTAFFVDYKVGYNITLDNYYHSWNEDVYSYGYYYTYFCYAQRRGKLFYSSLNLGLYLNNFGFYGGISTNSADLFFSAGLCYNIPLRVH